MRGEDPRRVVLFQGSFKGEGGSYMRFRKRRRSFRSYRRRGSFGRRGRRRRARSSGRRRRGSSGRRLLRIGYRM